jgi:gamma-glutamylcyclotransferase (GGCT)/AIG2-like uncharacterized protein YtfP
MKWEHNGELDRMEKTMKADIRVFVYGTLKKGHPLHILLERGKEVEFIGRNYINESILMVDMGNYPALVWDELNPDDKRKLFGEVYTVDPETLASLDYAEGHPHYYKRHKIRTADAKYPRRKCWTYILTAEAADYAENVIEDSVWNPIEAEQAYVESNLNG